MKNKLKVIALYNPLWNHKTDYQWNIFKFDSIEEFHKQKRNFIKPKDTLNVLFYTKQSEVESRGLVSSK